MNNTKAIAFAAHIAENGFVAGRPTWEFLTQVLFTADADRTAEEVNDYIEYLDNDNGLIEEELYNYTDHELFTEQMENDALFNFNWDIQNDFHHAYGFMMDQALQTGDFDIFEYITEEVFTNDEGTDVKACMDAVRGDGTDPTAFAKFVNSCVQEGDMNFVEATRGCMTTWAYDIVNPA